MIEREGRKRQECWIRKNHMTINEGQEVYEIISYEAGNVVFWGSADKITKELGTDDWDTESNIEF